VLGWINTKMLDETAIRRMKSQGDRVGGRTNATASAAKHRDEPAARLVRRSPTQRWLLTGVRVAADGACGDGARVPGLSCARCGQRFRPKALDEIYDVP